MRKQANRNYQVMSHDGTFLQLIIQVGKWAQRASLPYVPYGALRQTKTFKNSGLGNIGKFAK